MSPGLELSKRLNGALERHPTETYWLVLPAIPAAMISIGAGTRPPHNPERKEIAQEASLYLKEQGKNIPIDESAVWLQLDALRNSTYYSGSSMISGHGEIYPLFSSSELQNTVNPLEAIMRAESHTDAQLRTEIQAAAGRLDNLAEGIRTTYSPEISGLTAAALYTAILLVYGTRRF